MTTIYLIRHAEAEGNLYRRIHGQYDSIITERGKKQIAQLEKRFADVPVDFVYSSDLFRARATAGAVTARGLPLSATARLREVAMGVWEDRTWGEVERFEPQQLDYFNNDPSRWTVEGCEDFDSLQCRLTGAILDIAARHDGKTAAIVSHGTAIRAFVCGIYGVPPQEISRIKHYDNTAVTLLRIGNGNIDIEYAGDNSHLTEELSTFAHQKWWRENTTFDSSNLRFEPFSLENDAARYLEFRRDGGETGYGAAEGRESYWLERAHRHAAAHPRALSLALIYDTPAGLVELDVESGADEKAGVIDFFYMLPEHRRTGIAVQLLGQAVSVYRPLGREKLRMTVNALNEQTLGFCTKYGFEKTGEYTGDGGRYIVLELDITVR
ncbi:probable phosphoglycerate mutase [Sporobacter termitidis DSM 10068]|uniref:Probable phosphoglycerate mutase n=1 Tax=Sporobacter termitidis DSM 10068 TaxID=1123282 RepID=A0A1M5X5I0_9FIRM|nr:GNAT family N-acetyltransferase [Sporobacter termitidis]SHH95041.1 probable phosphoglycerate mutase [Sporobacter termitidis DSM 10068]